MAVRPRDREIADLGTGQHGVVALRQLREFGLSESAVRSRVTAGRLHRIHAGVYAVGHLKLTAKGRWMAAVLACGEGAVLSHRSAAELLGIRASASARIELISPRRRRLAGIHAHETELIPTEVTRVDEIPCTTVARTLLDLASVVDRQSLEKAINEAEVLRVFDLGAVHAALERAGARRGTARLRATLTNLDPLQARTRSELERRFLSLCRQSGLPPPEVNAWIEVQGQRLEVDFLWRAQRLIVETDGYATHSTRSAFRRDRRRNRLLTQAGWHTLRFTWEDVVGEPDEVAASIRTLVAGR